MDCCLAKVSTDDAIKANNECGQGKLQAESFGGEAFSASGWAVEEKAASPWNPSRFKGGMASPLFDDRRKLGSCSGAEGNIGQMSCEHLRGERLRQEPGEHRMIVVSVASGGTISCIRVERTLEEPRGAMVALLLLIMHDVGSDFLRPRHVLLGEGAKELGEFVDTCHNYSALIVPSRTSRFKAKSCDGVLAFCPVV
jgi:hypothetical protein